ncbi:MAG: UDP-N-acetylmuramoyl-tripeptide--D-alanyl-D-alanine ligase [Nitrospinae bacterium]|nr:UDP-N-acetylmuramoyl-tripeptide--D-alanyl-D-alanine ligase [Nitrospinota bacterium]
MNSDAKTLSEAVQGKLVLGSPAAKFEGVSINSRDIKAGELFFCIQGEHFDGHDFVRQAIEKKASGIVFSDKAKFESLRQNGAGIFAIQVADTLHALQALARFNRNQFQVRVVGVTGSNGKSTTKEMIASIAETKYKTLKNRGNLNNHIGLPLSLFDLNQEHELAVLEMGMSAAGEIKRLAEIAAPEIGVITNISAAHLVQLKTLKAVQAAKGELFQALSSEGTAVVNADDPLVLELSKTLRSRVVTFGIDKPADVTAADIRFRKNSGFDFTVSLFDSKFSLYLPFLGYGNIYNALAALATGHTLGITVENMSAGMGRVHPLSQRGEIIAHNSMTILNESYNANPGSMKDALNTLTRFQASGKKFFVMGDMNELANLSESAHIELGEEVARHSIDYLVAVGKLAGLAAQAAQDAGMEKDRAIALESHQEAVDFLARHTVPGDCILIKGSRATHMEKVVEGLTSSTDR